MAKEQSHFCFYGKVHRAAGPPMYCNVSKVQTKDAKWKDCGRGARFLEYSDFQNGEVTQVPKGSSKQALVGADKEVRALLALSLPSWDFFIFSRTAQMQLV